MKNFSGGIRDEIVLPGQGCITFCSRYVVRSEI